MPSRPPSNLSEASNDTPPLSPSSATRSSVASSNSSLSLGELSSRMSAMHIGFRVAHEPTECVDSQGSSRKFVHESVTTSNSVREGDIQEELDTDMDPSPRSIERGRTGHEVNPNHPERTSRPRPQMPRQASYSKRHSSFDTPREVPFPSGFLMHSNVPLPDQSNSAGDAKNERSTSVSFSPALGPGRSMGEISNTEVGSSSLAISTEGGANGESPPPQRPSLERSSSTSLPLPTATPYYALPAFSPPAPSPRADASYPPPAIPSTATTDLSSSSHLAPPPRTTSSNPPITRPDMSKTLPPSRLPQSPRPPDSPPFIADEPDLNNVERSSNSQLSFLSAQESRPHHSLPPPPKFMATLPLASSPVYRPMSLPQPVGNAPVPGSQSFSTTSPFPPPEPPTILTPPLPLSAAEEKERKPAPYEPFLPRDQPPPDHTYIAVETVPMEYRLIVRLPGFQQDSITLAMRRRRILHVVADNWSDGGGHFERRISFGYDADLGNIRAEFDGEILRIIVPRREPPGWFTQPTH